MIEPEQRFIDQLIDLRFIRKTASGYETAPEFIASTRDWVAHPPGRFAQMRLLTQMSKDTTPTITKYYESITGKEEGNKVLTCAIVFKHHLKHQKIPYDGTDFKDLLYALYYMDHVVPDVKY